MIHSFRSKFESVTNLSFESLKSFMIETSFFDDLPEEGHWVATNQNEVKGVIKLTWRKMKKSKKNKHLSFMKLTKKYGFFNVIKLNFLGFLLNESPRHGDCHIEHIGVDEKSRGFGIGKALMKKAQDIIVNSEYMDRVQFMLLVQIKKLSNYMKL